MIEPLHTERYKNCTIKIYPDEDAQSPDEWEDDNIFLVAYHRNFTVKRDEIVTEDQVKMILSGEYKEKEAEEYEKKEACKDIMRKYHIFGLEAYIHSGVVLALVREGNFPDRQWDVSYLGAVLVAKTEWKTKDKARKAALSLIETWNDYLSGNVYGYQAEGSNGEEIGGCSGFYGDYEKSGMLQEAKSLIDYFVESEIKKHEKKLKAQILHSVPLEQRKGLLI